MTYPDLALFCEFPNDPAQMWLPNKARCFNGRYHPTWRSRFSGQRLRWRITRSAKYLNATVRLVTFLQNFDEPIGRLLTLPMTPASSNASFAAVSCGGIPRLGQPFGIIQRRVPRDVTSIISNCDLPFARYGRAAY
jgi:hypothetical protein